MIELNRRGKINKKRLNESEKRDSMWHKLPSSNPDTREQDIMPESIRENLVFGFHSWFGLMLEEAGARPRMRTPPPFIPAYIE